jgi:MFS transporter, AAHS family, benzoate transport protein
VLGGLAVLFIQEQHSVYYKEKKQSEIINEDVAVEK